MIPVLAVPAKNIKNAAASSMYRQPYNVEKIKNLYPDKAAALLEDPAHIWRAETGIELIHKEPTLKEQKRIWNNWQRMTDTMKKKSDTKSIDLFDEDNSTHNKKIMQSWGKYKKCCGKNS